MKAYRVELLIVDFENLGKSEIEEILQNTKYVYPQVIDIQSADIGEWSDDHPLNSHDTLATEYQRLFNNLNKSKN